MSDSDEPIDQIDEGGDDLFGDDGDDDIVPTKEPVHEDDELASDPKGDSYARYRDRDDEDDQAQVQTKDRVVLNIKTYRHRIPKPKDGALRVLRIPKFLKIMPKEYNPDTFEPSEFDLENAKAEHPKHVARVRRDHSTDELKSNTNVFHWSDGSVTISVGGEHYEIQRKELAPPPEKPYNEAHDGHYYAAAAELHSNILMTVGHITEQYNVRPNKSVGDDALSILAEQIASASKPANSTDMIIKTTRDPELQKKQAELAEKERMKAQRRRENAAAKMDGGYGRTAAARGGLSIGDLEGGRRGAAGSRKRGAPGAGKPRRRRDEESDEELEDAVGRHEGYSLDDGFIVNSDDEAEESGAEDDDEEELLDDDEDEKPRSKRQRTRDRSEDEGSDVGVAGRARRRNVIDDDDD